MVVSVGTLLITFALRTPEATAAGLLYLVHSTLITGALFLVADMIGEQRGKAFDRFVIARQVKQQALLGVLFFVAALTVAGLPPFSGFLGKLVVLQAVPLSGERAWVWAAILVSSLATIIALSRAGTTLFWRSTPSRDADETSGSSRWQLCGAILLLAASPAIVLFGASAVQYTNEAAAQLHDVQSLINVMNLEEKSQ